MGGWEICSGFLRMPPLSSACCCVWALSDPQSLDSSRSLHFKVSTCHYDTGTVIEVRDPSRIFNIWVLAIGATEVIKISLSLPPHKNSPCIRVPVQQKTISKFGMNSLYWCKFVYNRWYVKYQGWGYKYHYELSKANPLITKRCRRGRVGDL